MRTPESVREVLALQQQDYSYLGELTSLPFLALAATVSRFDGPFQHLRTAKAPFSPVERFILDHCLAGDPDAIWARECRIQFMVPVSISRPLSQDVLEALPEYVRRHSKEIGRLFASNEQESAEVRVRLDDILSHVLLDELAQGGFRTGKPRKSKHEWRVTLPSVSPTAVLCFSKGDWKTNGFLHLPDLVNHTDIGFSFFFSQRDFDYRHTFEQELRAAFREFVGLLPYIAEAIHAAQEIRAAFLRGAATEARALAEALIPKPTIASIWP